MIINEALEAIVHNLKKDTVVQAIFLKGSIGRGEEDEHSDIDLYCLVEEKVVEQFLPNRITHLEAYKPLLFHDDIFIIAPQILAVYENLVHVDLFTVTEDTYIEKDYIKILYDPHKKLEKFKTKQTLTLSEEEFQDSVDDVAWFLFQYKKSAARGNDTWSVSMLHQVMNHLSIILLHHYKPKRAQLGMKTIESSLPDPLLHEIHAIFEQISPKKHDRAVRSICKLLRGEEEWIFSVVSNPKKIQTLWNKMIEAFCS